MGACRARAAVWIPIGLSEGYSHPVPVNGDSVGEFQSHFRSIIATELSRGRYVGPVTRQDLEAVLGPFQTSPISIIPKATPGKFRVVQNFSFPYQPSPRYPLSSVNSHLDAADFPCTWGTWRAVCILISSLPPGSQMAVLDVKEAYRSVPLHHTQWPAAVIRADDDEFYGELCASFGSSTAPGVYGAVADCALDIFRSKGMGPVTRWVDDHIFIRILRRYLAEYNKHRGEWRAMVEDRGRHQTNSRIWYGGGELADGETFELFEGCEFPLRDLSSASPRSVEDADYAYALSDVFDLSARLGVPWEPTKVVPFSKSATYFGFVWDVQEKTAALPREKADKYLAAIEEWNREPKHRLEEVRRLYGKLLHASLVLPSGRARLVGLERALGLAFNRPFFPLRPPKQVRGELEWWATCLQGPTLKRSVVIPDALLDIGAFSDASTGTGIGIVVGDRWRAWRLLPGWRTRGGQRDIGWAEAVGFLFLILTVTKLVPAGTPLRLWGDNEGVVKAWRNRRSRNAATNGVFKLALDHLEEHGFDGCVYARLCPNGAEPCRRPLLEVSTPSTQLLLPPC
ncbi:hypothetical protein NMY22_g20129 [Coprinellus aureogranulatus]|nr:hypothetical protein NMY22_g20129 [Coprinellus aureogranulatus]